MLANTAARIGTVESWTDRINLVHQKGMSAEEFTAVIEFLRPMA